MVQRTTIRLLQPVLYIFEIVKYTNYEMNESNVEKYKNVVFCQIPTSPFLSAYYNT